MGMGGRRMCRWVRAIHFSKFLLPGESSKFLLKFLRPPQGTCMVPRRLSCSLDRMVRLPSNGELARTRTAASARSRSRLTSHGTRDDTSHKSCDISKQRARTHALPCAPSCTGLRRGSAPTPRSGSLPIPPT